LNRGSVRIFYSTGQSGYSKAISDDSRHVVARKIERAVQVRFTPVACSIRTNEGVVQARAGDAILTGIAGEHWRVSRAHFADKYRPVAPTQAGEDGNYLSVARRILAVQMMGPFDVQLADGKSVLQGKQGDWLVDYGDGSLGIVSQPIFDVTYNVIG
jgi:hypothetical protein